MFKDGVGCDTFLPFDLMTTLKIRAFKSYPRTLNVQYDCDTIDTTRFGPRKLDAFHSDDMHCFRITMFSVADDTVVVWWMKTEQGNKKKAAYLVFS